MRYEIVESTKNPGEWYVEAFNAGDGECYLTIFVGSLAKERAEAYLNWIKGEGNLKCEVFRGALEAELIRRYDLCLPGAEPSTILLAVLNAVAEANRQVKEERPT